MLYLARRGGETMKGENLKQLRNNKKLTQSQLGNLVGCTRETISRLENNHVKRIDYELIKNICNALGIDGDDLEDR